MRNITAGQYVVVGRTRTCALIAQAAPQPIFNKKGRVVGRHILATHVSFSRIYPYHRKAAP